MTRNNDPISNASPAEDDEPRAVGPTRRSAMAARPSLRASGPARAATRAAGRRGRRASTRCCARRLTGASRIPAEAGGTRSA